MPSKRRDKLAAAVKADFEPAYDALGAAFVRMDDARDWYLQAARWLARLDTNAPLADQVEAKLSADRCLHQAATLLRRDAAVEAHFGDHLVRQLHAHILRVLHPDDPPLTRTLKRIKPNDRSIVTGYTSDGYPSIAYRGASSAERQRLERWEQWYSTEVLGQALNTGGRRTLEDDDESGWRENAERAVAYKKAHPHLSWSAVARNHGVSEETLRRWRRKLRNL